MKRIILLTLLFVATFQALWAQVDVLTQHNDFNRTGWNNKETILTTANVNRFSFGLYISRPLDDKCYTQPLVVSGVNTVNGSRNVVYVATVNNTVYAYDADDSSVHNPYWSVNLTPPGMIPPNNGYIHPNLCGGQYADMSGNFGIVGTPVIDKSSGTLYVVSRYIDPTKVDNPVYDNVTITERTYTQKGWFTYLYAMDITNGNIRNKVLIDSLSVTYPGTGDGSVNRVTHFDSRRQFNRPGLVLSGGVVYASFAAHCDWNPCHGWVIGYDATTLQLKVVYNATPNDGRGGIWMSGTAPSVDASGHIYFATGNAYTNEFNQSPGLDSNRGLSVVKIAPNPSQNKVSVASYFTPQAYISFDNADWDFDIGVMLIPNSTWAFTGLKSGDLLFMDQNNLGGYSSTSDNVLSVTSLGGNVSMHSNFSYFKSASSEYLYLASERANIKQFPLIRGNPPTLGPSIDNAVNTPGAGGGYAGGYTSTSSNDTLVSTAILWLNQADNSCNANASLCPGILRAFQATNIVNELWNSDEVPVDAMGIHSKMNAPTIANGKVYVPTLSNKLQVYANRANSCLNGPNIALNRPATSSSFENSGGCPNCVAGLAFDGNINTRWSSAQNHDPEWIYVDLGAIYDVCGVTISWESSSNLGVNFNLDISNDAVNWTTMKAVTGNSNPIDIFSVTGTGRYVRMFGLTHNSPFGYSIWEMGVVGNLHNQCLSPTLSSPTNLTTNSVTLHWQAVPGATSYNVQYKATTVQYWTTISTASLSTSLSALTCSQDYAYQVQAVCPSGNSSYSPSGFTTSTCAVICGLPTRYSHADIGTVGQAGTSCFNSGIFTIQGSGSAIGSGGADAFQYAWINAIVGSDYYEARITSQDATNSGNMAGLMMRDSITPWSSFAYIARTSGNGFVFMYRLVPGGATTSSTMTVPGNPLPYWVKINKTGNTYGGFISPDGLTWTQVGSNATLNFGSTNPINTGIAITATNNSALSTAILDNYQNGVALPVKLGSFTAVDIDDEYVDLRWTTLIEQLNDHFEIERSGDGIHFEQIGTVPGAGSTDIPQNYSMQDYHPLQGINYYRLKQVNLNREYTYSPVIHVRFGKTAGPLVYPNPAHAYFTVESGKEPVREISLFNVSGSELLHMINATGWNSVNVTTDKLPAGVYLVRIKTDAQIYQQKIIIQ